MTIGLHRHPNPNLVLEWQSENNSGVAAKDVNITDKTTIRFWTCQNNLTHVWPAPIVNRRRSGCPVCAGKLVLPGVNDLNTTHPSLAAQAVDKEVITKITYGSSKKIVWQDTHSHQWSASPKDRVKYNTGCPYCSIPAHKILAGFNDIKTLRPDLFSEWDHKSNTENKRDYLTIGVNYSKKVAWTCKNNSEHLWEATPHSRNIAHSGCPICAGRVVASDRSNSLGTLRTNLIDEWHTDNKKTIHETTVSSAYRATWVCSTCTNIWDSYVYHRSSGQGCPNCIPSVTSGIEAELQNFIRQAWPTSKNNVKGLIPGRKIEADCYIPELQIAFELNGTYWHSEKFKKRFSAHRDRFDLFQVQGIRLIQIWEDDWRDRRSVVEKMISHRLGVSAPGVGANKTVAQRITKQEAERLLEENHIQGFTSGSEYVGLRLKATDALVAVLVATQTAPGVYKIDRYATSMVVSGGFSKILTYMESLLQMNQWYTFADQLISNGDLYRKTGFRIDKVLKPDYKYLYRGKLHHKFSFRRKRFKNDPNFLWDEDKTERELAEINGLLRVWDAGKIRFVRDVAH